MPKQSLKQSTGLLQALDRVGLELRRRRQQRQLTQETVAKSMGVSAGRVARIEAGEPGASLGLLVALLRHYEAIEVLAALGAGAEQKPAELMQRVRVSRGEDGQQ